MCRLEAALTRADPELLQVALTESVPELLATALKVRLDIILSVRVVTPGARTRTRACWSPRSPPACAPSCSAPR